MVHGIYIVFIFWYLKILKKLYNLILHPQCALTAKPQDISKFRSFHLTRPRAWVAQTTSRPYTRVTFRLRRKMRHFFQYPHGTYGLEVDFCG